MSYSNITSLEGIEKFINLEELNLEYNELEEINELFLLENLKLLNLFSNKINKISGIEKLYNLEELILSQNNFEDYIVLKDLKNLKVLYLNNSNIYDLDFLKDLKKLKEVDLSSNHISDISILKYMNLEKVILYGQVINIDSISVNGKLSHELWIKDIDNNLIMGNNIKDINSDGVLKDDKIEWNNLYEKQKLNYFIDSKKDNYGARVNLFNTNIVDEKPTIIVEDKVIEVGEKFDPLIDVKAIDKEDGDISKDIKILENTVNSNVIGSYKIIYEVKDSAGNVVKKQRGITVIDKDYKKIIIKFDGNNGKFAGDINILERKVERDTNIKKEDIETPVRENYVFNGWTTTRDGEDYFNFDNLISSDVILFAKWQKRVELKGQNVEYTVGDKVGKEKLREDIIKIAKENDIDVKAEVVIKFLDENINIDNLTNKAGTYKVKLILGDLTEIVEITVKEKPVEEKFIVDFETFGGNKVESQKIVKNGKVTEPKNPINAKYKFNGWYLDKEFTKKYDFKTPVIEDIILYAKWTKKSTDGGETTPPTKPEETVDIDYVILANGDKYTDVLTATVLGNELKAPILLTKVNYMDEDTKAEIKRLNPKNIIISGGDGSVSEKLVKELKDGGYKVERLSGIDRYGTAREIAKKIRSISGIKDKVTLVDGTNFPDVITISTYSSIKHAPILLTEPESLNNVTKKALSDFNISNITIGGGDASVSKTIEKFLKADYKVNRIGGHDRYKTASLIAKEVRSLTGNKDDLILVDGTNFPDGITINSLAGKYSSPIHLTNPNTLEDITKKDIKDFNIKNILIGGGDASVSENTIDYLKGENINTERISGSDRYKTAVKISERFTEK